MVLLFSWHSKSIHGLTLELVREVAIIGSPKTIYEGGYFKASRQGDGVERGGCELDEPRNAIIRPPCRSLRIIPLTHLRFDSIASFIIQTVNGIIIVIKRIDY